MSAGAASGTGRHRLVRLAIDLAAGTGIYLAVVGTLGGWAVLQGALCAALAGAIARGSGERARIGSAESARLRRVLAALPDLLLRQVVRGSWQVARAAAGLAPVPEGGLVVVPLSHAPDTVTVGLALLETLSPGTYLVAVDAERRELVFHVFDRGDRETLRRRQARLLGGPVPGATP